MDTSRDEQLRQRAYMIWESEGRPEGMEAQHWARAERELVEEGAAAVPAAAASPPRRKASAAKAPVDPVATAPAKTKPASAAPKAAPRRKKD